MIVIDKFSAKSNNHLNLSHHTPPFNQNNILVPPPQRHPYKTLIKPTSHPELTPLQMAEISRNQLDHVDPYFFTLPSSPLNEQLKPYTRIWLLHLQPPTPPFYHSHIKLSNPSTSTPHFSLCRLNRIINVGLNEI